MLIFLLNGSSCVFYFKSRYPAPSVSHLFQFHLQAHSNTSAWCIPKEHAPKPLFASGILHSSVSTTVIFLTPHNAFQPYRPWLIHIYRSKLNPVIALMLSQKALKSIFCCKISWAKSERYFGFTSVRMSTMLLSYSKYVVISSSSVQSRRGSC